MKHRLWPLIFLYISLHAQADLRLSGTLQIDQSCLDGKAVVWLSRDHQQMDELLYHVNVPDAGSFAFSVLPGEYTLRVSSAKGCEWEEQVIVQKDLKRDIQLRSSP